MTTRSTRVTNALSVSSASALSVWALIAIACSSNSTHPSLISVGGQSSNGGRSASVAGVGGNSDLGGASGEDAGDSGASATSGGDGGDGGTADQLPASGGKPPTVPPTCNPLARWSAAKSVAGISSAAKETLVALTPDELDLAFLRDGELYVAHRESPDASFSVGSPPIIPAGWSASHGASLSADGKRLLLVSDPDQTKLGELTRTSRAAAFAGTIDTSAFTSINQDSSFTGMVYAWPTVSAGDDQLFYNSSLDVASTVVVSTRTGQGVWTAPRTLSAGSFEGADGKRRLPTGVSADGRTLFYFNEDSAEEEVRFRASSMLNSPLYDMYSLGKRRGAVPNAACNRLYSEANGDVVVEQD